ncbi:MAG: PhnD/SsuA/transferrin family substrate-binding protein [Pseudomonadota bacterium]
MLRIALVLCSLFTISVHNAWADWREDIGVFRIGVVVPTNIPGNLARMEPFRLAISEALEMDVEFFPASNGISVIDALATERIEYAIISASGYALASVRCECVEPLVIPRSTDSTDGYHLVGLMRAGSAVKLEDLPAMNVAALSTSAIAGSQFIEYLLLSESPGLKKGAIAFQGKDASEDTLLAFYQGQYDILFGWSSLTGDPSSGYSRGSLRQIFDKTGDTNAQYKVVWKSRQIPHRPHVIRKKLPGEVKQRLRSVLVNLFDRDPVAYDSIEPEYGGGFTAARNERFRELIAYLETFSETGSQQSDPVVTSTPEAEETPSPSE